MYISFFFTNHATRLDQDQIIQSKAQTPMIIREHSVICTAFTDDISHVGEIYYVVGLNYIRYSVNEMLGKCSTNSL